MVERRLDHDGLTDLARRFNDLEREVKHLKAIILVRGGGSAASPLFIQSEEDTEE
jgi:hypothetical protein